MSENWYCLYTKPQKEPQVAAFCADQLGLATYFPRLRQYRVIRRQKRLVTSALFPRYLFCRFDAATLFRAVRYAPDVAYVVSAAGKPLVVGEDLVGTLRSWAGAGNDEIITVEPTFRVGDAVEIVAGPLQGLSGKILTATDESVRVRILLDVLQCGAQASVEQTDLRLIPTT